MVKFIRSDLDFILQQILLAEANAATIAGPGTPMLELLPNAEVPWGLRTVTGVNNNLVPGQSQFGAADTVFPRLTTPEWVTQTNPGVLNPGVNPPPFPVGFDYSLPGNIIDATPRIASNLIVDQTANNPAAVVAALTNGNLGLSPTPGNLVTSPGLDGLFGPNPVTGINDDTQVYFIQNTTPDFGLTAPFNSWMTFFGQFFDHGLDLLQKSKTEIVYIPLQPDDPLYNTTPNHFMALSRAVGATGVTGAGGLGSAQNITSPFVDQNQTYTSHPSHQVFLREYAMVGC